MIVNQPGIVVGMWFEMNSRLWEVTLVSLVEPIFRCMELGGSALFSAPIKVVHRKICPGSTKVVRKAPPLALAPATRLNLNKIERKEFENRIAQQVISFPDNAFKADIIASTEELNGEHNKHIFAYQHRTPTLLYSTRKRQQKMICGLHLCLRNNND